MTTHKQKFNSLMQTAITAAREKFTRDGFLPITWLIEDKYDTRILIVFDPTISNDDMLAQMTKIARDKEIMRYTVETEAWMVVSKPGDNRRPKDRPDRMEAIVIYGQDRRNNTSCVTIEIERKGEKAFLGETTEGAVSDDKFRLFPNG